MAPPVVRGFRRWVPAFVVGVAIYTSAFLLAEIYIWHSSLSAVAAGGVVAAVFVGSAIVLLHDRWILGGARSSPGD